MIDVMQGFSSLVLNLKAGNSEAGKALYKDKSYPRVMPTAAVEDLYAVGAALAGLSAWELNKVECINRKDLYKVV
jgi:hypothetical protein